MNKGLECDGGGRRGRGIVELGIREESGLERFRIASKLLIPFKLEANSRNLEWPRYISLTDLLF